MSPTPLRGPGLLELDGGFATSLDPRGVAVGGSSYNPRPVVRRPPVVQLIEEETLRPRLPIVVPPQLPPSPPVIGDPIDAFEPRPIVSPPPRPRAPIPVMRPPPILSPPPRPRAPIPVVSSPPTLPKPSAPEAPVMSLRAPTPGLGIQSGFGGGPPIGFGTTSIGDLGQDTCERIGIPKLICAAGREAIERYLAGGNGTPGSASPGTQLVAQDCPPGSRWNPDTGQCELTGVGPAIQRMLPGGRTGTLADRFGDAVIGGFGIPGLVPAVVGQRQNARGETNPILECPSGAVLGKDNICYMKGSIPKSFRKWPPGPRAPVTASDAKAIRKAESARKRVKKLAGNVGFKCSPKRGR